MPEQTPTKTYMLLLDGRDDPLMVQADRMVREPSYFHFYAGDKFIAWVRRADVSSIACLDGLEPQS